MSSLIAGIFAATAFSTGAFAQTLTTLVSFAGTNGRSPATALIFDPAGNLYGVTSVGGASNNGTVFEIPATNRQTLMNLVSFSSSRSSGEFPGGALALDSAGNLYGMMSAGGTNFEGTIYRVSGTAHQTLTTLVSCGSGSGQSLDEPFGALVSDAQGNLLGTTFYGGASNSQGTIFELSAPGYQTVSTINFANTDGAGPAAGLISDANGNFYGTTASGGAHEHGTVFELSGTNHQTLNTLYSFSGTDGSEPTARLAIDSAGNLYGTTTSGAAGEQEAFELSGTGRQTFTLLANIQQGGSAQSADYQSGLTFSGGNLYGVTRGNGAYGDGTIFELSGANYQTMTTVLSFNGANGSNPNELVADTAGNLFGTTAGGGASSDGTVFELTVPVPDPSGLSLLVVGSTMLLGRRRRKLNRKF